LPDNLSSLDDARMVEATLQSFESSPIRPGSLADYWPEDMWEPLILGLVFRFINRQPWQLRSTLKMFSMARKMRDLFATKDVAAGNILQI
jgi:hypothetical protein